MSAENIVLVAKGQKIIIYSILAFLCAVALGFLIKGGYVIVLFPICQLAALYGVLVTAKGLGSSVAARVVLAILMLVPIIALFLIIVLASRASKALKENGYKVGFLGAKEIS